MWHHHPAAWSCAGIANTSARYRIEYPNAAHGWTPFVWLISRRIFLSCNIRQGIVTWFAKRLRSPLRKARVRSPAPKQADPSSIQPAPLKVTLPRRNCSRVAARGQNSTTISIHLKGPAASAASRLCMSLAYSNRSHLRPRALHHQHESASRHPSESSQQHFLLAELPRLLCGGAEHGASAVIGPPRFVRARSWTRKRSEEGSPGARMA